MAKIWETRDGKIQRCVERFTPQIARELLENNPARLGEYNLVPRHMKPTQALQYATSMKRHEFDALVNYIHLAPNGAVLNGQHRLTAIIMADMAVDMDVVKNTPPEWYGKFDTGHRTHRDYLVISQSTYTKVKSSMLPMLAAYLDGKLATYRVDEIPHSLIHELNSIHADELDEAIRFSADAEYKQVFVAFLYFVLNREGHLTKCLPFLEQFKDGSNAARNSPALALRRYIRKQGRNARTKEVLARMFSVANAIIDNQKIGPRVKADWSFRLSSGRTPTTKNSTPAPAARPQGMPETRRRHEREGTAELSGMA